ncbi:MAG: imidazole glycerol phosphate synthase subunit HisH [Bacteroidota bacterium]
MIAIIDYGMGNVASIQKALNYLQLKSTVTSDHSQISDAECLILPGVGSFKQGMLNLRQRKLDDLLTKLVVTEKKSFLGICLGMQLIAEYGTEPEFCHGLGWIKGDVKKIELTGRRVPHMGWNDIEIKKPKFYEGIKSMDFYFIHSYHFIPQDESVIDSYVNYGTRLVSSIQYENIFATQFHPEKSQESGLKLLKNYFASVKG